MKKPVFLIGRGRIRNPTSEVKLGDLYQTLHFKIFE